MQSTGVASGVFSISRYAGSITGSAALGALLGAGGATGAGGVQPAFLLVVVAARGALAAGSRLDGPART